MEFGVLQADDGITDIEQLWDLLLEPVGSRLESGCIDFRAAAWFTASQNGAVT
jgi:hypothetical protein